MSPATLKVNDNVELAYLDSRAPEGSPDYYTTIFVVHGMIFMSGVFEKMLAAATKKGVHVVAIQHCPFSGSTPFSAEEFNITLTGGTEAECAVYLEA
ncbi:hypothetical protein D9758_007770 [Tetrapyrgos nigripes]|uniref:Uncharacterized protein n=1 Tax=Tetrapyrgos nigripes TaxID=182062 RepID=A0A8H5D161_9AGAR|nr:hypothetical protein D9758_007770 [Tetrapyrgos nigripes]